MGVKGGEDYRVMGSQEFEMIPEFEPDGKVFPIETESFIGDNPDALRDLFLLNLLDQESIIVHRLLCSPEVDDNGHMDKGVEDTDGGGFYGGKIEKLPVELTGFG